MPVPNARQLNDHSTQTQRSRSLRDRESAPLLCAMWKSGLGHFVSCRVLSSRAWLEAHQVLPRAFSLAKVARIYFVLGNPSAFQALKPPARLRTFL